MLNTIHHILHIIITRRSGSFCVVLTHTRLCTEHAFIVIRVNALICSSTSYLKESSVGLHRWLVREWHRWCSALHVPHLAIVNGAPGKSFRQLAHGKCRLWILSRCLCLHMCVCVCVLIQHPGCRYHVTESLVWQTSICRKTISFSLPKRFVSRYTIEHVISEYVYC